MYPLILTLHSWMRWIVVIVGVIALVKFLIGWLGKKDWAALDARLASIFPVTIDIQFLLGLLLYFVLSPITTGALRDFGAAMKNSVVRFYTVEHILMMLIALIVAHIGSMMIKKRTDATAKFRSRFHLLPAGDDHHLSGDPVALPERRIGPAVAAAGISDAC